MILDISDIINRNKKGVSIDFSLTQNDISNEIDSFEILDKVSIKGNISYENEDLCVVADISGEVLVKCSRCLEDIEISVNKSVEVVLTSDEQAYYDELDSYYISNNEIDIKDLCILQIMEEIPFKVLCRSDCKGLCPVCGTNHNNKECDCVVRQNNGLTDIDLEKLKEFLSQRR